MRLIDADVLIEEIKSFSMQITGLRAGKGVLSNFMNEYRKSVLRIIDEEPTAYDEKQIPKKLVSIRKIKEFDGYDMGNCPTCGEPLDNSFYENLKYCFVCGQAIDWSEEE